MNAIDNFRAVWNRCAQLADLHNYLTITLTSAMPLDEILRSEWVARVSALDLYIHELIAQKMMEAYEGIRPTTPSYLSYKISIETLNRIRSVAVATDANSAFELETRNNLARITYQDPETIADGIRLISPVELWNELAVIIKSATPANKTSMAKSLKKDLSLIVSRRNKIAHEGDLQPTLPREPWPISRQDLIFVKETIEQIVFAIDSVV